MLAIKIWNYFKGYVIIRVEGLTLERLLNLAATYDIYLWDIKRYNNVVLEMKSSTAGFKELRDIVKKVGCRVEIREKIGLPFLILKLKDRKMFVLGFLIFILSIYFLTSTIWTIEIYGNDQTPKEKIIEVLRDKDIFIGKLKFKLNKDELKDTIIDEFQYFSFVSINIKGTKLIIEVKEQDLPPELVDKSYPCHIVANKKAVIQKVIPKNGKALVEKGDVVNEGDVLITGIINEESNILVHSEGEVFAKTRYTKIVEDYIVKNEDKYTGNVYREKGIKFKEKGIMFMKGNIPFDKYKETREEKDLINLKKWNIDFPIKKIEYKYREVETKEVKQNIEFLKKTNQIKATKKINEELPEGVEIQSKTATHDIQGNILKTQVTVETIEDIGRKQIIKNRED